MFKTRDFLPIIVTAIIVFGLAIATVVESGICLGDLQQPQYSSN